MTLDDLQRRTIFAAAKAFSSKENHCQNLDRRPAKFLTRLDQLMMTPKVEFLKYSINILHVVKFIFQNVKSCKHMACIVNHKIKHHELETAIVSLDHYIKHHINFPADKK